MKIAFFGSSLLSAYWNGAATYYRGMIRALFERGHEVTFYEPDAFGRQENRDIDPPHWARSVVYPPTVDAALREVEAARDSDLVIKASGVGVNDALLEEAVLDLCSTRTAVAFWDVDAPATLERLSRDANDPFHALVPRYDAILTYGGGAPVKDAYAARGARLCMPIYNALDPATHHPVDPSARFRCDISFLGNRLPDREARVEEFFLKAAALSPHRSFLLGGSGWRDKPLPSNVRSVGHVFTVDHNAFNCSAAFVLNVSRESMARFGFSPATRVFEVAGAGACLITDVWEGIDEFFEPGVEILVARNGEQVAAIMDAISAEEARDIGIRAREHALAAHTYAHRADQFEQIFEGALTS